MNHGESQLEHTWYWCEREKNGGDEGKKGRGITTLDEAVPF